MFQVFRFKIEVPRTDHETQISKFTKIIFELLPLSVVASIPTSNQFILSSQSQASTMSDDDDVFVYQSGDDDDGANDDDNQIVVPRKFRGPGRIWEVIDQHPTFEAGKVSMQKHNDPVLRRLKGTLNRGKTLSQYYYCVKKSCGCTKQWRLVTSLDSHLVTEEESTGDHINHDKEQRNGGRGLSFDQVKIVDDAFAMGVKKPLQFIKVFERKAKLELEAG